MNEMTKQQLSEAIMAAKEIFLRLDILVEPEAVSGGTQNYVGIKRSHVMHYVRVQAEDAKFKAHSDTEGNLYLG